MFQNARVVVIGGGRAAQAIHLPLLRDVGASVVVVEPVAELQQHLRANFDACVVSSLDEVGEADVAIVATPWRTHHDVVIESLGRGWDVLCEKPASLVPAELEAMQRAAQRLQRVVQVGYMKQWDGAFRAVAAEVARPQRQLVAVVAEVFDCNDPSLLQQRRVLRAEAVRSGSALDHDALRWITGSNAEHVWAARAVGRSLGSSLLHEVNLVRSIVSFDEPVGLEVTSEGAAVTASWRTNTGVPIRLAFRSVEGTGAYSERIQFVCSDAVFELTFPPPYGERSGATLSRLTDQGLQVLVREQGSPFRNQLEGFERAIIERRVAPGCDLEAARADLSAISSAWLERLDVPLSRDHDSRSKA